MNKTKKDKLREVPIKNYVYLFLILLGSMLLLYYIYIWYETYNENKLNTSIMNDYLTVINYNELDNYIIENKDAIIYVSVLGSEVINRFERNLTNENKDVATKELQINENFPYLVVYTNGQITDTYNIAETNYSSKKTMKYLNRIGATEND